MMNEVETIVRKKSSVLSLQQERLENELKKLNITCTFTGENHSLECKQIQV